jgi:hypothetical protein
MQYTMDTERMSTAKSYDGILKPATAMNQKMRQYRPALLRTTSVHPLDTSR